jgi:hypothetical protein
VRASLLEQSDIHTVLGRQANSSILTRLGLLLWVALLALAGQASRATASSGGAPTEYQVKAVFVYNFSHFVAWPAAAFAAADQPFVIGIVGQDPFGSHLDEAVRGEQVNGHPLVVRHLTDLTDVGRCQILFIDSSEAAQLDRILVALDHHSTLTVSDVQGASRRGVMIQFETLDQRIRLRINPTSARAAGLNISAPLLQLAQIDRTED